MEPMENHSVRSLKQMAKTKQKTPTECKRMAAGIDDIGEDLLQSILNRLPALSFASAACVSRSWNSICSRLLSSPKLCSAVSFNLSLENAVTEVVDKVLSEPIRPHFALASIGPFYKLQQAHELIGEKFGSRVPVITNVSEGIIGRDMHRDKFVEVQWELTEDEDSIEEDHGPALQEENVNRGIILTVGFLPGLKSHVIPLLFQKGPRKPLMDEFVMDIREYTTTVSDSASPDCIVLFADHKMDIKPVLQMMEYAFSPDTVIVGDGGSQFLYKSSATSSTRIGTGSTCGAVALVFGKDRNKPSGIGETKFHAMLSPGLSPIGVTYKAASVKCYKKLTCLTASRGTLRERLDGETLLEEIYNELGERIQHPAFYIGVTKRRKCAVGMEKVRWMQILEFHEVLGGNEEHLIVSSVDIKTGDPFRFYISDSKTALSSCDKITDNLRQLKQDCVSRHDLAGEAPADIGRRGVFGGILFSCCGRGDSFFGRPGIDSSPFLENFPGVTFGGTYCAGEIGRMNLNLSREEEEKGDLIHCLHHAYSAVYLVMSYCPPSPIC